MYSAPGYKFNAATRDLLKRSYDLIYDLKTFDLEFADEERLGALAREIEQEIMEALCPTQKVTDADIEWARTTLTTTAVAQEVPQWISNDHPKHPMAELSHKFYATGVPRLGINFDECSICGLPKSADRHADAG